MGVKNERRGRGGVQPGGIRNEWGRLWRGKDRLSTSPGRSAGCPPANFNNSRRTASR